MIGTAAAIALAAGGIGGSALGGYIQSRGANQAADAQIIANREAMIQRERLAREAIQRGEEGYDRARDRITSGPGEADARRRAAYDRAQESEDRALGEGLDAKS